MTPRSLAKDLRRPSLTRRVGMGGTRRCQAIQMASRLFWDRWDRAGIQQQLRAYGGRHNGETDRENRASLDRLERTTKDACFLVSILQVREQVVSFYVSFPESALNASIALIVSIPRHASMDGLSLPSSSGRDH